jgi:hypothetical protein
MKLKETARRLWRNIEALAFALDYDQHTDLRLRIERLERLTAHLASTSDCLNRRPES